MLYRCTSELTCGFCQCKRLHKVYDVFKREKLYNVICICPCGNMRLTFPDRKPDIEDLPEEER